MENMRMSKYAVTAFLALCFSVTSIAQEAPVSQNLNPYLDPALQDYVEMVYGYKNPVYAPKIPSDLRDSLTSISAPGLKNAPALKGPALTAPVPGPVAPLQRAAAVPGQYYKVTFANENGPLSAFVAPLDPNALTGFKVGDYVFISLLPKTGDHAGLISALSANGFKFSGEKTFFTDSGKKTYLLGWVPYASLTAICGHPGVLKVAMEKKAAGMPIKTNVRFTLRAPSGERADEFVADFLKRLNDRTGFTSESVVRLPQNPAHAKFTAFDVTGSLPVDMVSELSRSPFVAAVEFNDKSL